MVMVAKQASSKRAPKPLPSPRPAPRQRPARPASPQPAASSSPSRPSTRARRIGPTVSQFSIGKQSTTNYESVILAEFVAAIILVAVTPFATKQSSDGLSPYAGADMIKLAALTTVYLILALLSLGGRGAGRYAAWFGGLILLGVGLNEAANIVNDLDLLAGIKPSGG